MKNKTKLWLIFGPVICAVLLLMGILSLPWERTFSKGSLFQAAASQTTTVFKGKAMRQKAYKQGYVPFYGSSELSRFDNMHPTVLATKYKRDYMPFLLGGPGSQSLSQYLGMQGAASKKAVMIISPQWFTAEGQDPAAFTIYYSPLHAADFLLKAQDTEEDRYAARRLLQMPSVKDSHLIYNAALRVAAGLPVSKTQRALLIWRRRMLANEDTFFTSLQLRDRLAKIKQQGAKLPKTYSYAGLKAASEKEAAQNTKSNRFGIRDSFYKRRLNARLLRKLKGSQKKFDYIESPEYSDFELMLDQFAQDRTQVLFIIPPVNAKWREYTGLSQKMYEEATAKMKYQMTSQGFTNIIDLTKDGGKKYFMEDTIHLGWNGWLTMDQAVRPFMAKKYVAPSYYLDDYYYTRGWRERKQVPATSLTNKQVLARLRSK